MEIDAVLRAAGLPILRLTNEEAGDREGVKEKVLSALRVV
jgi:very-short-patch-repair endonuclease